MIRVNDLSVEYQSTRGSVCALQNMHIDIGEEFLGLIGPSGCGKTTLLRVLAGLVKPTSGSVEFNSEAGYSYGIVFQDYSLLPWLTARENIELGLKLQHVPLEQRREIGDGLLRQLNLEDARNLLPHQLSGGMRQRVAIGRAFAPSPSLLLMDEPFGALDAITRGELQQTLSLLYESIPHTVAFVTHDVEEAMFLCDRICVLTAKPGHLKTIVEVPFPRPRDKGVKRNTKFLELRGQIEDLLRIPQVAVEASK